MPETSGTPVQPMPHIHRGTVHQHDVNVTIATHSNVILFVGRGVVSVQALECTTRIRRELAAEYPNGVGLVVLAHGMPALPSADVQRHALTQLPNANSTLKCIALVTPQTGFWVSALRSILTPVFRARSKHMRISMFSNTETASKWMCKELEAPAILQGSIERMLKDMADLPLIE